jgi:hypothetical protein
MWNLLCNVKRRRQADGVENGVLRKLFWPKRVGITENWRNLQDEELH